MVTNNEVDNAQSRLEADAAALAKIAARTDANVEPADRKEVYVDAASDDANEISVPVGGVATTDIYERVFPNNSKAASYILRYAKGHFVPFTHATTFGQFRSADFTA